jgi:type II secretory pathway component PulF
MSRRALTWPLVGPCLTALALQRFSVALRMTSGTGMPLGEAVRLSLRATGNDAFADAAATAVAGIEGGNELAHSLARTGLFPREYIDTLAGAEIVGRLDDVLERQAAHQAEEAERRLAGLSTAFGYAVWAAVGGLLVFVVLRIGTAYARMLS